MFIMASGGDERMIEWMKYAEIQVLKQKGFKKARVAKMLNINRETVAKYWTKPPDVFECKCQGLFSLVG